MWLETSGELPWCLLEHSRPCLEDERTCLLYQSSAWSCWQQQDCHACLAWLPCKLKEGSVSLMTCVLAFVNTQLCLL